MIICQNGQGLVSNISTLLVFGSGSQRLSVVSIYSDDVHDNQFLGNMYQ